MSCFYKQIDYEQQFQLLNKTILYQCLNQIIADYAFYIDFELNAFSMNFKLTWRGEWKSDLIPNSAGICPNNGLYFVEKYYIMHSLDITTKNYAMIKMNCDAMMFVKDIIRWNTSIKHFQMLCIEICQLQIIEKAIQYFHSHFTQCDVMMIISTSQSSSKCIINCGFVKNFAIKEFEADQVKKFVYSKEFMHITLK